MWPYPARRRPAGRRTVHKRAAPISPQACSAPRYAYKDADSDRHWTNIRR